MTEPTNVTPSAAPAPVATPIPLEPKTQAFAVAGFALGIASCLSFCCCMFLSIPCAVVAIVLSSIALSKVRNGTGAGREFAIPGLICGIIGLLLIPVWILFCLFADRIVIQKFLESFGVLPKPT